MQAMVHAVIGLLILTIPLGFATRDSMEKQRVDTLFINQFRKISPEQDYRLQEISIERHDNEYLIQTTIYLYTSTSGIEQRIAKLRKFLERETGSAVKIKATILRASKIVDTGTKR